MTKTSCVDLTLVFNHKGSSETIGKLRITDNTKIDVLDANEDWKDRINQVANTINQVDEIPVIGGTKINRLGAFTAMETVKKGDDAFTDAVISYLKINGFDAEF